MLHYLKTVLSTTYFLIHLLKREIQNNKSSFVIAYEHICFYTLVSITAFLLPWGKNNPMLCFVLRVKYHLHDGTDFYYWYLQYPDA